MRKRKHSKATPDERAYEMPREADLHNLTYIGEGLEAVKRFAAGRKTVELDGDVVKEFSTSEQVNLVLRMVIEIRHMAVPAKRRKTA